MHYNIYIVAFTHEKSIFILFSMNASIALCKRKLMFPKFKSRYASTVC